MLENRRRRDVIILGFFGLIICLKYTLSKQTAPEPEMSSYIPRIYELSRPRVWGGHDEIVIGGDAARDAEGNLLVYRAGPFMPPITLPGMGVMVVNDQFHFELQGSGLTGLTFWPAIKHRIVEIHWEHWDRQGEMGELPKSDLPTNLLYTMPHSEEMSASLGPLWDVRTERLIEVTLVRDNELSRKGYALRVVSAPKEIGEIDFFGAINQDRIFISERAKLWLEARVAEWVHIRPVFVER